MPNIVDDYDSRCLVSDSVLNGGKKVNRLFREEPEEKDENYSGWVLYSDEDDEEYFNDSNNWHYVSLGVVLNIGDQFIGLLKSGYDSEYVWDSEINEYREV